jgi:hypothetical protein
MKGRGQRNHDHGSKKPARDTCPLRTMTSQFLPEETDTRMEAMTATMSPCCAGKLVNNHHSHGAVTAGTVPPPYAMPWCGEHDLNDHAWTCWQDRMDCWPSLLASPSLGLLTTWVGRTLHFCMYPSPHRYIRRVGLYSKTIDFSYLEPLLPIEP